MPATSRLLAVSLMNATALILVWLLFVQASFADERSTNALQRNIVLAEKTAGWNEARTAADRMKCIREAALKHHVVSSPVSDRYLITELGGPIDLVHFFGVAIQVCTGERTRENALLKQWEAEGGADFEAGRTAIFPTEAHPDDLPSNAFGALLGEELRAYNAQTEFDIVRAIRNFLAPLIPVPDAAGMRHSHSRIVMGLPPNATRQLSRSRREWFTAEPLFVLPLVNPAKARILTTASDALRAAGFGVQPVAGRPIGIARLERKAMRANVP